MYPWCVDIYDPDLDVCMYDSHICELHISDPRSSIVILVSVIPLPTFI